MCKNVIISYILVHNSNTINLAFANPGRIGVIFSLSTICVDKKPVMM